LIQKIFKEFGFDPETVTEEDSKLIKNMTKASDIEENPEYEGTGGEPPKN